MNEKINVSVEEDGTTLLDDVRAVIRNNKTVFMVAGIVVLGLWVNRAMIRRELKHINFTFERGVDFDTDYLDIVDDETTRGLSWADAS